ncbi:aminodeoxychorismate/anthranilate synthase component II [Marinomonas sp. 15G1-11]|uniref:Aminodeoxychorismate/anthranilate synthase component II n=1 Tax=Marinomonas phaeophyticola TaxID=3004091 RepID=A0ABT4JZJ0_9GAMM|nr:aminodeoxychorismate/anthranilate synthase component II [Marinomonas sp. 15G1-11]MCZ2723646.1 aminodeoxychorismate/anthranilate synthase component II [Marinomonas sp. 15G1-11]
MKVYIIDNYDSFTYNLYQYIGEILTSAKNRGQLTDFQVVVKRNDGFKLNDLKDADRIIISPGPGSPEDESYFGKCAEVIKELGKTIPLMGVCLGMQGIVHVFGGRIVKAPLPMHGKTSPIQHDGKGIFHEIPDQLEIMRYHSLIAESESFPEELEVTAAVGSLPQSEFLNRERIVKGGQFEIMGVRHKHYPIQGIQFHPESFATEGGKDLIRNFLFQV